MRFTVDGRDYTVKFVHSNKVSFQGDTCHLSEVTTCQLREYRNEELPDFADHFASVTRYAYDVPDKTVAHKKALARAMKVAGFDYVLRTKLWNAYFNRRKNPRDFK